MLHLEDSEALLPREAVCPILGSAEDKAGWALSNLVYRKEPSPLWAAWRVLAVANSAQCSGPALRAPWLFMVRNVCATRLIRVTLPTVQWFQLRLLAEVTAESCTVLLGLTHFSPLLPPRILLVLRPFPLPPLQPQVLIWLTVHPLMPMDKCFCFPLFGLEGLEICFRRTFFYCGGPDWRAVLGFGSASCSGEILLCCPKTTTQQGWGCGTESLQISCCWQSGTAESKMGAQKPQPPPGFHCNTRQEI